MQQINRPAKQQQQQHHHHHQQQQQRQQLVEIQEILESAPVKTLSGAFSNTVWMMRTSTNQEIKRQTRAVVESRRSARTMFYEGGHRFKQLSIEFANILLYFVCSWMMTGFDFYEG